MENDTALVAKTYDHNKVVIELLSMKAREVSSRIFFKGFPTRPFENVEESRKGMKYLNELADIGTLIITNCKSAQVSTACVVAYAYLVLYAISHTDCLSNATVTLDNVIEIASSEDAVVARGKDTVGMLYPMMRKTLDYLPRNDAFNGQDPLRTTINKYLADIYKLFVNRESVREDSVTLIVVLEAALNAFAMAPIYQYWEEQDEMFR